MKWQVKYALANLAEQGRTAEHLEDDLIKVVTQNQPDVLAAISPDETINRAMAGRYIQKFPGLDFLCGYRTICVWEGEAILFLEASHVGWGNLGTLLSATHEGSANTASHKVYKFSDRLLRQCGRVERVVREFDRVHRIFLKGGETLRVGMLAEYEPVADSIRTFCERFGHVDIMWNINPSGRPSPEALDVAREIGCEVMKWDELRDLLRST